MSLSFVLQFIESSFTLGLLPNCVVLVATIRAIKMHGGGPKVCEYLNSSPLYNQSTNMLRLLPDYLSSRWLQAVRLPTCTLKR